MAHALQTTPLVLQGGDIDRPPGHGRAGRHPVLTSLTLEQCQAHLAVGGVGRIVYSTARGPTAVPVNFEYTQGQIVISTGISKASVLESAGSVGFEVDRIDEGMSEGWSVLATGPARRIDDPDECQRLSSLDLEVWAGGNRHVLIGIAPTELTGRVIIHELPFEEG